VAEALGLQRVDSVQFLECELETISHAGLSRADPYARIVEFLVWLVSAFGVTALALQVAFVLDVELANAIPLSPLGIRVDVHLDDTVADGLGDFFRG